MMSACFYSVCCRICWQSGIPTSHFFEGVIVNSGSRQWAVTYCQLGYVDYILFLCLLSFPFLFFLLLLTLDELTKDVLAWHNASKWEEGHFYFLVWMFYISTLSSRLFKRNETRQYGLLFCPRRGRIKSREFMSHPWNGIVLVIFWKITNNIIIKCKLLIKLYICKVGMDQGFIYKIPALSGKQHKCVCCSRFFVASS